MSDFIYNEDTRIHTIDGKVIPSVSNIVEPLSLDYSKAHPGKLSYKRDLGVAFHECIQLYLYEDLDEDSVDEDLKKPMQQFVEYWEHDEDVPTSTIVAIEQPFCSEKLKYCGKPNLITEDCVYDWKVRKYDPICDPLRMAGYAGLINDYPHSCWWGGIQKEKIKFRVVEFSNSGYRVHDAEKAQANSVFRAMLKHYWKQQTRHKEDRNFETLLSQWRKSRR